MKLKLLRLTLSLVVMASVACSSGDESEPETSVDAEPALSEAAATPDPEPAAEAPAPEPPPVQGRDKRWNASPSMSIDPSKTYTATFELAKGQEFEGALFAGRAPMTVNNFVFLAREGFYDGITFHRVIENFMAQTGDPTGVGSGGPGYRFDNEFHDELRHDSGGTLSMANAGIQNGQATNGSQFFITFRATEFLDGLLPDGSPKDCAASGASCHAVFGRVSSGMDVVNNLTVRDPSTATSSGDVIATIRITEE